MMWYHRIEHVDGVSFRTFATEAEAKADMEKSGPLERERWSGRSIDSNGGAHSTGRAPYGVKSARGLLAMEKAYDARETGTLTPAQKAMLTRLGL